jgi:hypothetical protein
MKNKDAPVRMRLRITEVFRSRAARGCSRIATPTWRGPRIDRAARVMKPG